MSVQSFVREYALTCYPFDGNAEDQFVARLIYKHVRGKRVLDLGCGPVVPVTSVFYPNAVEVVAVDRLQANLSFVQKNAQELNEIVSRARKYKHTYLSAKDAHPRIKLVKGDVTKKLALGKFDSVMNLGCFGALDNQEQFQKAVDNAYRYLKPTGTLLMVNWIGNAKRPFHFNGKADSSKLYKPCLEKAGFRILELHKTTKVLTKETKKLGYHQIIWAVAKKR